MPFWIAIVGLGVALAVGGGVYALKKKKPAPVVVPTPTPVPVPTPPAPAPIPDPQPVPPTPPVPDPTPAPTPDPVPAPPAPTPTPDPAPVPPAPIPDPAPTPAPDPTASKHVSIQLASITLSPSTVVAGSSTSCTIKLNAVPTFDVVASVSVDPAADAVVPKTVTFPKGTQSVSFAIKTNQISGPDTVTVYSNYNVTLHAAMSVVLPAPPPVPPPVPKPTFIDTFAAGKLDTTKWIASNWGAPGNVTGVNQGTFDPTHLDFTQGMLRITVTQTQLAGAAQGKGVVSVGGEIQSKQTFGYGTYDIVMRMSSTSPTANGAGSIVSGSDSGFFTFLNNSETEIDIEYLGANPSNIWLTNWINTTPANPPTQHQYSEPAAAGLADGFHDYKMVWAPGKVDWYIDGKLMAEHTQDVPSKPAYIMLNFWGTNSTSWGGLATVGTTRYFYVKSVSFTPAQ